MYLPQIDLASVKKASVLYRAHHDGLPHPVPHSEHSLLSALAQEYLLSLAHTHLHELLRDARTHIPVLSLRNNKDRRLSRRHWSVLMCARGLIHVSKTVEVWAPDFRIGMPVYDVVHTLTTVWAPHLPQDTKGLNLFFDTHARRVESEVAVLLRRAEYIV